VVHHFSALEEHRAELLAVDGLGDLGTTLVADEARDVLDATPESDRSETKLWRISRGVPAPKCISV
jgi:hypothetical protein